MSKIPSSRLKAPGFSKSQQSSVPPVNCTSAPQIPSNTTQNSGTSALRVCSPTKKALNPSSSAENQQGYPKVVKPVIPGCSQKGTRTGTILSANQSVQHGTGPYDRTKNPGGTIPYVGKKRPSGVLKAPDRQGTIGKPQMTNGNAKASEKMTDPNVTKRKIVPPKSSENRNFAVPKPVSKRMTGGPVSKGCSDITKIESPRRQTIGSLDSNRSNPKLGLTKNSASIRPRSCLIPNKSTEIKNTVSKKSISRSLQNIPKSIPAFPLTSTNKGFNKKDVVRKSGSHDDILNCTKKEPTFKKPIAGVIPQTKSGGGFTSKFGFGKPAERPRSAITDCTTTIISTPLKTNSSIGKMKDHELSPIDGINDKPADNFNDTFALSSPVSATAIDEDKYILNNESVNRDAPDEVMEVECVSNNSTSKVNKDLNDTKTINIIINLDTVASSQEINTTSTVMTNDALGTSAKLNETYLNNSATLDKVSNIDLNETKILKRKSLNETYDKDSRDLDNENLNHLENHAPENTDCIDKSDQSVVLETTFVLENGNETRIITNDSLDKSDSGFDDTNHFNMSDISPPDISTTFNDTSYGDLKEDVLKVIAAISSNINRQTTNSSSFSSSPMKGDTNVVSENNEYICSVGKNDSIEGIWLDDNFSEEVPLLEGSSLSQGDECNTLYQTDEMLSKSTNIDMSSVTSNNTQFQDLSHLIKFSTNSNKSMMQSNDITYTEEDVFKDNINGEDLSLCTNVSQSTDQLRNCLSSIGTDTEEIEDTESLPDQTDQTVSLSSNDNIVNGSIFIGQKGDEIIDRSFIHDSDSQHQDISSSIKSSDTVCSMNYINSGSPRVLEDFTDGHHFEIPTSTEDTELITSEVCTESICKEIAEAVICDSGHSTDLNDNEISSVLSEDMRKLGIDNVIVDLFAEGDQEMCPSETANDFEKSLISDATYPSTPLSRQESLEYELSRRCNTIDCTRRMKKVVRSRTYSSSELITKFRIPKELKCVETSEGDILMNKTTFLHFMNEVKLVKTSLLKLKRTLVQAQCTSPLVKSPLKRANSAVEASAIPPLSPRTCQCSPMAVVNPLVLSTGSIPTATKEKENVLSSDEQIAILNEKLQDSDSVIKLLQTQLENHEQKEQDIIEENILLREEISHLTERIRVAHDNEGGVEGCANGSFSDFHLSADQDPRLSILQRMYTDG